MTLSHQTVHSGAEFVSVNIDIHNNGTVRFQPAGFVVNAYGYRYLPRIAQTITKSITGNVTTLNRALAETRPALLQSGYATFVNFGSAKGAYVVAPGVTSKLRFAFGIPRGAYDVIFLKYKYCIARNGNTRVYNPGIYRDSQGAYWFRFPSKGDLSNQIGCGQVSRLEFPL